MRVEKSNTTDKIYAKIIEMQQKPLELRKVFSFSVESLQDNPETCFREIKEYLDMHSDKIEDFYFESYIDQETFAPIMVIHVIPNVEWRSKMMRNEIFENMLPAKILVSRIRQRLQNTMNNYLFEFNDTTTRKNMVSDIQKIITTPGKYTLCTKSDDGSNLYLDGTTKIVDNDGSHGDLQKCGDKDFTAGSFKIVAVGFNGLWETSMQITYKGPDTGGVEKLMPSSMSRDSVTWTNAA